MPGKKDFWVRICFLNLTLVALFGFALRTKLLFPVPWLDYRGMLSAHSHFAFGGWVGLSLMTLLVYNLLPSDLSGKKVYQWILASIQFSSLGMALTFPFGGYYSLSIIFSTLFIIATYWFGIVFIKHLFRIPLPSHIKVLAVSSLLSLMASAVGPILLSYILITKSANSYLYRDAIYTFLHFQYNGFFTLGVFAILMNYLFKGGLVAGTNGNRFAVFLSLSVLPALFLSLLWHNSVTFYVIAGIACILILITIYYFLGFIRKVPVRQFFTTRLAGALYLMSLASFVLKMILNAGTIIPQLGNAVYADRPVIIGFLHLVFLAFVSFFILSFLLQEGYFTKKNKPIAAPFYVFGAGVLANELLLGLQGIGILFRVNSDLYGWLLWFASIILFLGAVLLAVAIHKNKKATGEPVASIE